MRGQRAGAPSVAVAVLCRDWRSSVAKPHALCRRAATAAARAAAAPADAEVSIVLADDAFVRRLNRDHRGTDRATNVLAFPTAGGPGEKRPPDPDPASVPVLLGDVVLAHGTVVREAPERGISIADHLGHLVVHGVLHLLGYDHDSAARARRMEGLEVDILAGLGIADPYRPAAAAGHAQQPA